MESDCLQISTSVGNASASRNISWQLENEFQRELNTPVRRHSVRGPAKSRKFKEPHRDPVVCSIEKVESLGSEDQPCLLRKRYCFDHGSVGNPQVAGPERVAWYSSVLANRSEQSGWVDSQLERLPSIIRHYYSRRRVRTICEVAVKVYVIDSVHSERLTGLKDSRRRNFKIIKNRMQECIAFSPTGKIGDVIGGKAMACIEVCGGALSGKCQAVLRQGGSASEVKYVRNVIVNLPKSVVDLKLSWAIQ